MITRDRTFLAYEPSELSDAGSRLLVAHAPRKSAHTDVRAERIDTGILTPLDVIDGTVNNDTLYGTESDDTLSGLGGSDSIYGYGGNDSINGGTEYDNLYGGNGNDTLVGGDPSDAAGNGLSGEAGDDSLTGTAGSDNLNGGNGSDTLSGGDGNDYIYDSEGDSAVTANQIYGGNGNDYIRAYGTSANSATTIAGGAGQDTIEFYAFNSGSLTISDFTAGAGGDVINIDSLLYYSIGYNSGNPFRNTNGFLRVVQDAGDTLVQWDRDGVAATDYDWKTVARLQGVTATNLVSANFTPAAPPDGSLTGLNLTGTAGNDTLKGSVVNDTLDGGDGYDNLSGYGGNDRLLGGLGYDYLYGGDGNDVLIGGDATDTSGNSLNGEDGDDKLTGTAGQDYVYGGEGSDTLAGGGGNDTIGDNEYLNVATSNNIAGGGGNDYIQAIGYYALSAYTVSGGAGRDTIDLYSDSLANLVFTDFTVGASGDVIGIDSLLLASTGYSGGNPFGAELSLMRLLQSGPDTLLQWDPDGAGSGFVWRTVLTLQGVDAGTLVAANFLPYAAPDGSETPLDLLGSLNADTIHGSVSNDTISARSGYDTVYGYGGDDVIDGGADYDNLYGGAGNDTLTGGGGADLSGSSLYGEQGDDSITGTGGGDNLSGGNGSDTLVGGAGNDTLNEYENDDAASVNVFLGGDGDDYMQIYAYTTEATVRATGGAGIDTYELLGYSSGSFTITDFTPGAGGDVLKITSLTSYSTGFPGGNLLDGSLGYIRLVQQGSSTLLQWDRDASSVNYAWRTLAELKNVTAGELTSDNFEPAGDVSNLAIITNHLPTGQVQITGTVLLGATLNAANTLADTDGLGTVSYQWLRDGVAIEYATGSSYVVVADDVGATVSVRASFADGQGMLESKTSAATGIVDDYLGDASSTAGLAPGQSLSGVIQVAGDADWFAVQLQAGASYAFELRGASTGNGTLGDPYLQLLDANGNAVGADDDGGGGLDARIAFTAGSGGTYYLAATGLAESVGDYLLRMLALPGANLSLTGTAGSDTLLGGVGDDTLDGGAGADSMSGGKGNDTYVVDNADDTATELANGGVDTVLASIAFTLGAALEKLVLTGATGLQGGGNALANTLTGTAGADTLNGGAGADLLNGGTGNDTFVVDNAGDQVVELAAQGNDLIKAALSWTLPGNVEDLLLTGAGDNDGTGNVHANTLTGNAGNNTLSGRAGNDDLLGGDGNDVLSGDTGNDLLDGGIGTDTASYESAGAGVTVSLALVGAQDTGGAGSDTLVAIERLLGSAWADTLTGSGAANALNGDAGNDTLNGAAGNDTLTGGTGVDRLTGGTGADRFDFNAIAESGPLNADRDRIVDFSAADGDRIDLATIDANTGTGANDAFTYIGTAAFSNVDASGQARYNDVAQVLLLSTDADNDAEFSIYLPGVTSLVAGDLIL